MQLKAEEVKRIRESKGCSMQEAKSEHIKEVLNDYMDEEFQGLAQVQQVLKVIIANIHFTDLE